VALLQNDFLTNDTLRQFCTINLKVFRQLTLILKIKKKFLNKFNGYHPLHFLTISVFNFWRTNGTWY